MKFDDIMRKVLTIFPDAELGEDNDGQLIVYTGLESSSSEDDWIPIEEEDPKSFGGALKRKWFEDK